MEKNARYLEIAKDIGNKIVNGDYSEGDVLRGRSILAAEYNVSPETIRKAMNILNNEKVVTVKHGVGVYVGSPLKAKEFVDKFGRNQSMKNRENIIKNLMEQKKKIDEELSGEIVNLINSYRFSLKETISFQELLIEDSSWVIDHSIGDIYFYNYTEATIVAVMRDGIAYTSPGPDFILKGKDILVLVSKDNLSYERALAYITFGAGEE